MAFPPSFVDLIEAIEEYAYLVLVLAAAYYLWLTIRGTEGKPGEKAWGVGAEQGKRFWKWGGLKTGWSKEAKEAKRVQRKAKREKTAVLNEYLEEKKELTLLEDAEKKLAAFEGVVNAGMAAASTKKNAVTSSYDDLLNAARAADKEVRRLKSRTWRQERRAKALLEELEDDKLIEASKLTTIKSKEAQILKLHDDLNVRLDKIMAELEGPVGAKVELVRKSKGAVLSPRTVLGTKKIPFASLLADIYKALLWVKTELVAAKKDQEQSYKDAESFVADFGKLWK